MSQRNMSILCIGGLDPGGAAGILADLRMVHWRGLRAAALVTLLTAQSRRRWLDAEAVSPARLRAQWSGLSELSPAAIKIGAIADQAQAEWLCEALDGLSCPVVLDPVLSSSSGGTLSPPAALRTLAQRADVCTPNREEAAALFELAGETPDWHAGCPPAVLVTGGDGSGDTVVNRLLTVERGRDYHWPRRPGRYRGTGCLLATALAVELALGQPLEAACQSAQQQVQDWIGAAQHYADGVHLPHPPA